MRQKSNPQTLKVFFTVAQILVFILAIAVLLWVMAVGYKEDVRALFTSKLDHAAETMASQLKSNQVPSSLGPEGFGVFIINHTDGSVIIDKHAQTSEQEDEWVRYRTKLIYEMQKQKRGWIVYPEKKSWEINQEQRVIRYLSIEELGWILAVEAQQPSDLQLLSQAFRKSNYIFIAGLMILGALIIWLLNERYFYLIWRSITDTVENNFMSLSGEDSIWDKFKTSANTTEDLQKEALGLGSTPQKDVQTTGEDHSVLTPLMVESLRTPQSHEEFKPIEPQAQESKQPEASIVHEKEQQIVNEVPVKEKIQEPQEKEPNQLTINVNEIKSQALKKIIKQFREK